jgi:hypothetical protein
MIDRPNAGAERRTGVRSSRRLSFHLDKPDPVLLVLGHNINSAEYWMTNRPSTDLLQLSGSSPYRFVRLVLASMGALHRVHVDVDPYDPVQATPRPLDRFQSPVALSARE